MVQTIATERRVNPSHKVREISVPRVARSLSTLSRIDYEDGFIVDGDPLPGRRCERWARAVIEDTPAAVRVKLLCSWWALGLRVGSPWSAAAGARLGGPARRLRLRAAGGRIWPRAVG